MASKPPKTRDEQMLAGYKFSNHARCRGCHQDIEWWTTPRMRKIPVDLMQSGNDPWISHFATCPDVDQFRGGA
jgi:hypothetical protein